MLFIFHNIFNLYHFQDESLQFQSKDKQHSQLTKSLD